MESTDTGDGASQIANKMTPAATYGLSRQEALASSPNTSGFAVRFKLLIMPRRSRRPMSPKRTVSG
eukprot:2128120-Karenia_brevis.AAC.1